jgi:uncharacterized protein
MLNAQVLGITQMQGSGFPAVLLGHEDRILFISIGLPEAGAIQLALLEEKTPRPMTHDLICNILAGLRISLESVAIYKIEDQTFFAYLNMEQRNEQGGLEEALRIDARPSDAIAIALRVGCPILVNEAVMDEAGHDASLLRPLFEGQEEDENDNTEDVEPPDFDMEDENEEREENGD